MELQRPAWGFLVKAELKMTPDGKGIGVFAAEFIPANTRVLDMNSGVHQYRSFNEEEANAYLESLPNDEQRKLWLEYCYGLDGKIVMDCDDAKMINHADNPTIFTHSDGHDYTTRDVREGEELTEDYRTHHIVPFYEELCDKHGVVDWFVTHN